ncbi:hypothetical protein lerEdw1_006790 [Lerista edwardsae]|nr:hypothetical protein lerEdw1_006790 [Lerista edwardsae]
MLALIGLWLLFARTALPCPPMCQSCSAQTAECEQVSSLSDVLVGLSRYTESILLRHGNLSKIPEQSFTKFNNLRFLSITGFLVSALKNLTFSSIRINSLRRLDLSHNHLLSCTIDPMAFSGLSFLDELILTNNSLDILRRSWFAEMPALSKLFLGFNRILYLAPRTFESLAKLKELDVSSNLIQYLPMDAFYGLPLLTRLDLSSNRLLFINREVFQSLLALRLPQCISTFLIFVWAVLVFVFIFFPIFVFLIFFPIFIFLIFVFLLVFRVFLFSCKFFIIISKGHPLVACGHTSRSTEWARPASQKPVFALLEMDKVVGGHHVCERERRSPAPSPCCCCQRRNVQRMGDNWACGAREQSFAWGEDRFYASPFRQVATRQAERCAMGMHCETRLDRPALPRLGSVPSPYALAHSDYSDSRAVRTGSERAMVCANLPKPNEPWRGAIHVGVPYNRPESFPNCYEAGSTPRRCGAESATRLWPKASVKRRHSGQSVDGLESPRRTDPYSSDCLLPLHEGNKRPKRTQSGNHSHRPVHDVTFSSSLSSTSLPKDGNGLSRARSPYVEMLSIGHRCNVALNVVALAELTAETQRSDPPGTLRRLPPVTSNPGLRNSDVKAGYEYLLRPVTATAALDVELSEPGKGSVFSLTEQESAPDVRRTAAGHPAASRPHKSVTLAEEPVAADPLAGSDGLLGERFAQCDPEQSSASSSMMCLYSSVTLPFGSDESCLLLDLSSKLRSTAAPLGLREGDAEESITSSCPVVQKMCLLEFPLLVVEEEQSQLSNEEEEGGASP